MNEKTDLPVHLTRENNTPGSEALIPLNTLTALYTTPNWDYQTEGQPVAKLWDVSRQLMHDDAGEMTIVNTLIEEYKKNGKFNQPVSLPGTEDLIEDEKENKNLWGFMFTEPYIPTVYNGMHRLYALHLIHQETGDEPYVHVQYSGNINPGTEEDDEFPYTTSYISWGYIPENIQETFFDSATSWLRSFKVNDNLWVDADIMSTRSFPAVSNENDVHMSIPWEWNTAWDDATLETVNEALTAQVNKMIADLKSNHFDITLPKEIITVNIFSEEDEHTYDPRGNV